MISDPLSMILIGAPFVLRGISSRAEKPDGGS